MSYVIDVTNAGAIHALLQYAPDVMINRIKIRAVALWRSTSLEIAEKYCALSFVNADISLTQFLTMFRGPVFIRTQVYV